MHRDLTITYLAKYKYGFQSKTIIWGNNVYVNEIENPNDNPRVEIVREFYASDIIFTRRIIFFVPKGTIINKFSINLD